MNADERRMGAARPLVLLGAAQFFPSLTRSAGLLLGKRRAVTEGSVGKAIL